MFSLPSEFGIDVDHNLQLELSGLLLQRFVCGEQRNVFKIFRVVFYVVKIAQPFCDFILIFVALRTKLLQLMDYLPLLYGHYLFVFALDKELFAFILLKIFSPFKKLLAHCSEFLHFLWLHINFLELLVLEQSFQIPFLFAYRSTFFGVTRLPIDLMELVQVKTIIGIEVVYLLPWSTLQVAILGFCFAHQQFRIYSVSSTMIVHY